MKEYPWDIFLGLTVSWIGSFPIIETAVVSLLLFLRGMNFCSVVKCFELDTNTVKTETSKLSLEIITSEGFGIFLIA